MGQGQARDIETFELWTSNHANDSLVVAVPAVAKFPEMRMWIFYAVWLRSIKINATDVLSNHKTILVELKRSFENPVPRSCAKFDEVATVAKRRWIIKIRPSET